MHFRVMSWNVNARRDCAGQAAAMESLAPDFVALQEVTPRGLAAFRELLPGIGLEHVLSGADLAAEAGQPEIAVRATLVASRWPLAACEPSAAPRQELVICAQVMPPGPPIEVVAVHIPTWANGREAKIETQEAVAARVRRSTLPVVLLGDFNSPKEELEDGTVVAFIRPKDARGFAGEVGMTALALAECGLRDAFRTVNGYGRRDASWYWKNRGRTGGFRLDHIFASASLTPVECSYRHECRVNGLSDHSPIVATFEIA